jgi:hypothetical protein
MNSRKIVSVVILVMALFVIQPYILYACDNKPCSDSEYKAEGQKVQRSNGDFIYHKLLQHNYNSRIEHDEYGHSYTTHYDCDENGHRCHWIRQ